MFIYDTLFRNTEVDLCQLPRLLASHSSAKRRVCLVTHVSGAHLEFHDAAAHLHAMVCAGIPANRALKNCDTVLEIVGAARWLENNRSCEPRRLLQQQR
jgi:hypothetical protein